MLLYLFFFILILNQHLFSIQYSSLQNDEESIVVRIVFLNKEFIFGTFLLSDALNCKLTYSKISVKLSDTWNCFNHIFCNEVLFSFQKLLFAYLKDVLLNFKKDAIRLAHGCVFPFFKTCSQFVDLAYHISGLNTFKFPWLHLPYFLGCFVRLVLNQILRCVTYIIICYNSWDLLFFFVFVAELWRIDHAAIFSLFFVIKVHASC